MSGDAEDTVSGHPEVMASHRGGWVTTNNAKEVSWPPAQQRAHSSVLPNLKGTVPMGKARREMMDKEFEHVVQSTSQQQFSSHPFTRGGFHPTKIDANGMWSESVSKSLSPAPQPDQTPKQTLRGVEGVLTQPSCTARSPSYRMPPETARTKKCQEMYISKVTEAYQRSHPDHSS